MAAKTAGQHSPTSASGTTEDPGASGAGSTAVTPVWSATRSGSQCATTRAMPFSTGGRPSGVSAPPATASTVRMAADAASVVTTGVPPSRVVVGSVRSMSTHVPDSGTLNLTMPSASDDVADPAAPMTSRRAPVDGCEAVRSSKTCQAPSGAIRCTGLTAMRPDHNTSGASKTVANGPSTSQRRRSRERTGSGSTPAATTSSTAACSNRFSSSPTGSSTRVMPATAAVPGMMHTCSAV
ncbi:Uncharacterised protein [Mycobacteroides abscessus subsp. abscessus]|nr:Uncharacterised protein [Mycobacteroides abscessus subsp. abscessus]SIL26227.1 Uncharacterised protein [Mycobacteroides abscessus subsp. abscessus]SKT17765.1 Uncharacterised protein [Mycobacteroides abscessus subsp. abscessus]